MKLPPLPGCVKLAVAQLGWVTSFPYALAGGEICALPGWVQYRVFVSAGAN